MLILLAWTIYILSNDRGKKKEQIESSSGGQEKTTEELRIRGGLESYLGKVKKKENRNNLAIYSIFWVYRADEEGPRANNDELREAQDYEAK